jgi:hypothetical protein
MLRSLDQGLLLMEVHVVREGVRTLPATDDVADFLEDLRDLEQPALTVPQRRQVLERMHRAFPRIVYGPV